MRINQIFKIETKTKAKGVHFVLPGKDLQNAKQLFK